MICELPQAGDKLYYMQNEVTIIDVYQDFHLAKIVDHKNALEMFVDFCTLSPQPDYSYSISLGLLRRKPNGHFTVY